MGLLDDYQQAHGLDDDQLASVLTEKLGRPIKPGGVRSVRARRDENLPDAWLDALELEPVGRLGEQEPHEPGSPTTPDAKPPSIITSPALVKERVQAIYVIAGRGASHATHDPQYAQIFAAHAGAAADAWIELGRHDRHVAQVLEMVTLGGPWGAVLWVHVSLAGSILIASGKIEIPKLPFQPKPKQQRTPAGNAGDAVADVGASPEETVAAG